MGLHSRALVFGVFTALLGCDGGRERPGDGGAAADSGGGSALVIAAPAEPLLPVFLPCPTGWRETQGEFEGCEPWPETGMAVCPGGQAHFAGTPGCQVVGAPCPLGEWPTDLPTDRPTFFVRAGAVEGRGTRDAPFATIGAASQRAPAGALIVVARGRLPGARRRAQARSRATRGMCGRDDHCRADG